MKIIDIIAELQSLNPETNVKNLGISVNQLLLICQAGARLDEFSVLKNHVSNLARLLDKPEFGLMSWINELHHHWQKIHNMWKDKQ